MSGSGRACEGSTLVFAAVAPRVVSRRIEWLKCSPLVQLRGGCGKTCTGGEEEREGAFWLAGMFDRVVCLGVSLLVDNLE